MHKFDSWVTFATIDVYIKFNHINITTDTDVTVMYDVNLCSWARDVWERCQDSAWALDPTPGTSGWSRPSTCPVPSSRRCSGPWWGHARLEVLAEYFHCPERLWRPAQDSTEDIRWSPRRISRFLRLLSADCVEASPVVLSSRPSDHPRCNLVEEDIRGQVLQGCIQRTTCPLLWCSDILG